MEARLTIDSDGTIDELYEDRQAIARAIRHLQGCSGSLEFSARASRVQDLIAAMEVHDQAIGRLYAEERARWASRASHPSSRPGVGCIEGTR